MHCLPKNQHSADWANIYMLQTRLLDHHLSFPGVWYHPGKHRSLTTLDLYVWIDRRLMVAFEDIWVAVETMFMENWPCSNWVVPYQLWTFWTAWVFAIWNDQGFRGCGCSIVNGALTSCQAWAACWPCVFSSLSWLCFAGSFFQLRPHA